MKIGGREMRARAASMCVCVSARACVWHSGGSGNANFCGGGGGTLTTRTTKTALQVSLTNSRGRAIRAHYATKRQNNTLHKEASAGGPREGAHQLLRLAERVGEKRGESNQ